MIGRAVKTYDYINRVVLTLPLSVYEGMWTHSPLSLLCITMILRVRRIFFEITTLPNRIVKTFDYINRVNLTLPLLVYEGTWKHSPLSSLCITMILRVRRIFF